MNALDKCLEVMLANLKNLPDGEYGELVDLENLLEPASLEEYLEPEPDVFEEGPIGTQPCRISVLGSYYAMQSPGTVVLYSDNLRRYFHTLLTEVLKVTSLVTRNDLTTAARLVAIKTLHHEHFHFDCNVLRHLFGSRKDWLREEALAAAWSRLKIVEERKTWNTAIGRLNGIIYMVLMDTMYRYRSPGYRDWILFNDEASFKQGLLDYIQPPQHGFLLNSGVPVQEIIYSMLGRGKEGQGFVEIAA